MTHAIDYITIIVLKSDIELQLSPVKSTPN